MSLRELRLCHFNYVNKNFKLRNQTNLASKHKNNTVIEEKKHFHSYCGILQIKISSSKPMVIVICKTYLRSITCFNVDN